jgi:ribosomal protein S18 acetylase RimI-like enzyme
MLPCRGLIIIQLKCCDGAIILSMKINNKDISISLATLWDMANIRKLEQAAFEKDSWPLIEMIGVLTFSSVVRWKAELGEKLIGFVAADIRKIRRLAWIATIAVDPLYRRMGIANLLMQKAEYEVKVERMRLSARASNLSAIQLYQKRGYEQIDVWPAYYSGGEDAVVMEKVLS